MFLLNEIFENNKAWDGRSSIGWLMCLIIFNEIKKAENEDCVEDFSLVNLTRHLRPEIISQYPKEEIDYLLTIIFVAFFCVFGGRGWHVPATKDIY